MDCPNECELYSINYLFFIQIQQQHDTGGVLIPSTTSAPTPQPKDQTSPFQQIQDAVLLSIKNGSSSHTFLRTFRQSVEALAGQPFA